jgi:DNA segregation ATPase FtsK/SpoIIIE-like protein
MRQEDPFARLLDRGADLTQDSQSKEDIEAELKRLAQHARSSGVYSIVTTQKPCAEVVSTNLPATCLRSFCCG